MRTHRDIGSILIIALWVMCFLGTLAVIIAGAVKEKMLVVKHLDERAQSRSLAEAGIKRGILFLTALPAQSFQTLKDSWASNPDAFREISVGKGTYSLVYQAQDSSGVSQPRYGMIDEERKININSADANTLTRLFQYALGVDDAQARDMAWCVIDWRDTDTQEASPSGGAEDSYYLGLPHPYRAKNAPFESIDELLLVKGFTRDVFAKVEPFLTIYGSGQVNINTAPAQVLFAAGVPQETVNKIMMYRRGLDDKEGTSDDRVFTDTSLIVSLVNAIAPLSVSESAALKTACDQSLTVASTYFTIKSAGRLNNQTGAYTTTCVVDAQGAIQYWSEG